MRLPVESLNAMRVLSLVRWVAGARAKLTPAHTIVLTCLLLATCNSALAARATIAVASNFVAPMQSLATAFEAATNHQVRIASGSSGKFYAQILQGAPFDLFLSADQHKPQQLVAAQQVLPHHQYTYAVGQLVLWSPALGQAHLLKNNLLQGNYRILALANPRLAPYGAATQQVLGKLGVAQTSGKRWVQGENIAQTFQFVITGHADAGFVAASQVTRDGFAMRGSSWLVPSHLHEPIRQDLVLLKQGRANPAAIALFEFIRSPKAQQIIRQFGYSPPLATPQASTS